MNTGLAFTLADTPRDLHEVGLFPQSWDERHAWVQVDSRRETTTKDDDASTQSILAIAKTIRQLDVRQAQEKLLANRQRWEQYTRKLPAQKQAAILERIKEKDAVVLAELQRKWSAKGLQPQK